MYIYSYDADPPSEFDNESSASGDHTEISEHPCQKPCLIAGFRLMLDIVQLHAFAQRAMVYRSCLACSADID
jgi:hypothetical protein